MNWIKKHATLANLFFALAWTYALSGGLYMVFNDFAWRTLADVIAYSTLLWLIGSSAKQESKYLEELEHLTDQNRRLKDQLRGAGL